MKFSPTTLLFLGSLAIVASTAAADSKSEVTDAIKKLKAQPNFSWSMSPKTEGSESASRQGPIEGKTEKGTTWIKGSAGDNSFEAVIKGSKFAVNYTGEWTVIDEEDEGTARIARRLKPFKDILESAEELVAKSKEITKSVDGSYTSELTPEGAKEIFGRLGRRAAESKDATGSAKFWVSDGVLKKYESTVKGKFTTGEEKKEVNLSRTVTVEIKDVGTTKMDLPADATNKL
jgi:hypothetical protein